MGPRGQEGYSQVPSAAAAVSVRHEEGVHAEESFLLTPSGTSICTSRTTHNDGHGKGRWGRLGRTMGCPRTKRRRKYCVGAALGFRILAVTILIVILGYIVAVSPIHYSDIVPSSQDTCGLEPDPIMRLKPLSTCKYMCNKLLYLRGDQGFEKEDWETHELISLPSIVKLS
jgi:hypothetical protein